MHTRKELLEFATRMGEIGLQPAQVARLLRLAKKHRRLQEARVVRPLSPKECEQRRAIEANFRGNAGPAVEIDFSDRITIAGITVPA